MNNFILTCCSTADMTREYFAERNIPYALFHYDLDGVSYPDDLGLTMPSAEFFKKIAAGAAPITSQVNAEEYIALIEPHLAAGTDVLHLTLSSGISGSYNSAKIAQQVLNKRYPDRKFFVVDSLAASSGFGLLVDRVADLRDEGWTAEDAYNWTEQNKLKLHHWFTPQDLKHLRRGGRVSGAAAIVGTLLNICPILNVDNVGHLTPRSKSRGIKNALEALVKRMEDNAQDIKNPENKGLDYSGKCYICNSACLDEAKELAALVESKFPKLDGKVEIFDIGTVIGSHTGCGTIALFFWGSERKD
ncbi:MAG: DegV family protein [Oscillospiraceae bacterium]|nr:DegV family protein [Oscillospiraceae bacterium]